MQLRLNTSWAVFVGMVLKGLVYVIGVLGIVLIFGLVIGYPVKWCWNYVMPHISNGALPEIGFWHALCLNMLAGFLIKPSSSSSSKS